MGIAKRIIRYRINSWFLSSQLGTVGHTVRDKSLDQLAEKHEIPDAWIEFREMAASPSKNDVGEGSYVDLTKARPGMAEFRSPMCS